MELPLRYSYTSSYRGVYVCMYNRYVSCLETVPQPPAYRVVHRLRSGASCRLCSLGSIVSCALLLLRLSVLLDFFFNISSSNVYLEAVTSQHVNSAISLYRKIRYVACETVVVTHTDRQSDIPALPDGWVTNTPSVKTLCPQQNYMFFCFSRNMLKLWSVEDGQVFLSAGKLYIGGLRQIAFSLSIYIYTGHAVAVMVEALRYKWEGRGFDS